MKTFYFLGISHVYEILYNGCRFFLSWGGSFFPQGVLLEPPLSCTLPWSAHRAIYYTDRQPEKKIQRTCLSSRGNDWQAGSSDPQNFLKNCARMRAGARHNEKCRFHECIVVIRNYWVALPDQKFWKAADRKTKDTVTECQKSFTVLHRLIRMC